MSSRSLDTLDPGTRQKAERFLSMADDAALDVLIYCTLRTKSEQAILYRQSRPLSTIKMKAQELSDTYGRSDLAKILMDVGPQHGAHVTNAAPGQSLHNYGYAFDGVPLRHGKPVWGTRSKDDLSLWGVYGDLADASGLEWAGHWKNFREFPHCQQSGIRWQELIRR